MRLRSALNYGSACACLWIATNSFVLPTTQVLPFLDIHQPYVTEIEGVKMRFVHRLDAELFLYHGGRNAT